MEDRLIDKIDLMNEIRASHLKSAMKRNPILFSKINQPINLNSMIVEKEDNEEQSPDTYHASFMSNLKKFYKNNNAADVEIIGGFEEGDNGDGGDDDDDYIYGGLNYEIPAQIEGGDDDATMDETNILQQTFGPFEYKKIVNINDFYTDEDPTG